MRIASERRTFLLEHLWLPTATGVEEAKWEFFQLDHLDDDGPFRIENKSRQIAWSWLSAAEAVAEAILYGQSSIFISINQEEAQEKIRYAHQVYEAVYGVSGLPKITRDNRLGIELANGARLSSLPARPPRGRARHNVYMDEFAHVRDDRQIYTAAIPIISKGGRLRIGSSPYGATGVFWEIFTQRLSRYPGYTRVATPWWHVQSFCRNVPAAIRLAPAMPTAERVATFGNPRIQTIFVNMPTEDFRQEFECEFVDETTAWITWEEIRAVEDVDLLWHKATCSGADVGAAFEAIDNLAASVRERKAEMAFAGGMDIGRQRDATEIVLVGMNTADVYPLRLLITLEQAPFDEQWAVFERIMDVLPVAGFNIDRNGIGMQLAEQAEAQWPGKAAGQNFTAQSKALWATDTKMLVQKRKTPLPVDRSLAYQIHSIKRRPTAGAQMQYDVERNEKHHADKFWAWALALASVQALTREEGAVVKVRSRRRR